jgi:predicted phosphatase
MTLEITVRAWDMHNMDASMYIYSTVSFDNFKQGISILHVTNATIIFEIVSDRPVEYKRSGCMLTPLILCHYPLT